MPSLMTLTEVAFYAIVCPVGYITIALRAVTPESHPSLQYIDSHVNTWLEWASSVSNRLTHIHPNQPLPAATEGKAGLGNRSHNTDFDNHTVPRSQTFTCDFVDPQGTHSIYTLPIYIHTDFFLVAVMVTICLYTAVYRDRNPSFNNTISRDESVNNDMAVGPDISCE